MKLNLTSFAGIGTLVLGLVFLSVCGKASDADRIMHDAATSGMDRIHIRERGRVHVQMKGLDADSRYELRTYVGILSPAPKEYSVDIFWGHQRTIGELRASCREVYGDPAMLSEVLPCPLPDVMDIGGLHRNWRTGRELMEKGIDINEDFSGNALWITYQKRRYPDEAGADKISLDGEWQVVTDPSDKGKELNWDMSSGFPLTESKLIQVPGNINEVFPKYNGVVWYAKTFPSRFPSDADRQTILHFNACSYRCEVWINGRFLGSHEGGESPFEFIVPDPLRQKDNFLVLRVFTPKGDIYAGCKGPCAYPVFWGTGGLIQGVEATSRPRVRIADVFVRADWKTGTIVFETEIENATNESATVAISAEYGEYKSGRAIGSLSRDFVVPPGKSTRSLETVIKPFQLWDLDNPFLYCATLHAQWGRNSDTYEVHHFGFRDFRFNDDGYYELNGKRLFVKCTHGNVVDPLAIEGTPRDMTWLGAELEELKAAGFNMYRSISYAALPEQLDIADELGLLFYDESQASWLMKDPSKFELDLPALVKRDRNHPSLVIWGLLNEVGYLWPKTEVDAIYHEARGFLPKLRAIDDTRVVLLSSGRFDMDFKTASASNPGSSEWNVFLGGEDPNNPISTHTIADDAGSYRPGTGDAHIYELHPISWRFVEDMARLTEGVRPIFVSEAGQSSASDPIAFKKSLLAAGANQNLLDPVEARIKTLEAMWSKYGLYDVYPNIEDMLIASQRMGAAQRAIFFNIIRSNPRFIGYNVTDDTCAMDEFKHFRAGHLQVLSEGWAKLKWCLFVNPSNAYSGADLRLRVSLANEGILPAGSYPAHLSITTSGKEVWSTDVTVRVQDGEDAPLAYQVFDKVVRVGALPEGQYTLNAKLLTHQNASTEAVAFNITDPRKNPKLSGFEVTVLGVSENLRALLAGSGLTLKEYGEGGNPPNQVIVVGGEFKGDNPTWESLYQRIASGDFALFLSRDVIADENGANLRLPLDQKGYQKTAKWKRMIGDEPPLEAEPNIFRSDLVALKHPIFSGLPTGVLAPDIYGNLLRPKARFSGITVPKDVAAVWTNLSEDGLVVGVYDYHQGKFLINSFDLIGNIGQPAADRLIFNMVDYARTSEREASKTKSYALGRKIP